MPTIFRKLGFRFFFYSDEGEEPSHVHFKKGDGEGKYWLEPLQKVFTRRLNVQDERKADNIVRDEQDNFRVLSETILSRERPFHAKWSKCKICAYASLFFMSRDKACLVSTNMLLHHALLTHIFFHFHIKKQFPEVPFKKKWYDYFNGK